MNTALRTLIGFFGLLAVHSCGGSVEAVLVSEVGFATPESVLHDRETDLYLVSNINGGPLDPDDNGFISRLRPDGALAELKWIDGADPDVELNAPKGMALTHHHLWVADIGVMRKFDRRSGKLLRSITVVGATFLNDVTATADGVVYVTDTGLTAGFQASNTDAIYKISPDDTVSTVLATTTLAQPNGIVAIAERLHVVCWNAPKMLVLDDFGEAERAVDLGMAQLDGIVVTPQGRCLVSSWEGSCILEVTAAGARELVSGLRNPADIGHDATRNRLLVPLFSDHAVKIISLPGH